MLCKLSRSHKNGLHRCQGCRVGVDLYLETNPQRDVAELTSGDITREKYARLRREDVQMTERLQMIPGTDTQQMSEVGYTYTRTRSYKMYRCRTWLIQSQANQKPDRQT